MCKKCGNCEIKRPYIKQGWENGEEVVINYTEHEKITATYVAPNPLKDGTHIVMNSSPLGMDFDTWVEKESMISSIEN